ncbi:MAG: methylglyoxal synthase [Bacteroidia bacterium]|nr:methylglyoxal synthase [Bacteroidia bacterium]
MKTIKRIALVAHDNCKQELLDWVKCHWNEIIQYELVCTGTTGNLVEEMLLQCMDENGDELRLKMTKLKSGPLGGDQQLGAAICNAEIDALFFFWDAMEPQPHDVDIKALLRIATLYNIIYACSRSTADLIITSPFFSNGFHFGKNEQIDKYKNRILQ